MDVDQLKAVADTQDGQTELKDGRVVARRICIIDTVWTSRDDDTTACIVEGGVEVCKYTYRQ